MSQLQQTNLFAALQGQHYMNLITFRKNGQPVVTPVWFAQEGERLYVTTDRNTGKIKRIRNNHHVQVGPSDGRGKSKGPVINAVARILPPEEAQHAKVLIDKKYGLVKRAFDLILWVVISFRGGLSVVFLEIVPENQ